MVVRERGAAAKWSRGARAQAVMLVALGLVCGVVAVALRLPAGSGLLALGLGLLIAHLFYRPRLFIPGVTATLFAVAYLLNAHGAVSNGQLYGVFILAAGLSVGVMAVAARRDYEGVGREPLTPALLLILIGLLVVGTTIRSAGAFYATFVSLTMPAIALTALGALYFFLPTAVPTRPVD